LTLGASDAGCDAPDDAGRLAPCDGMRQQRAMKTSIMVTRGRLERPRRRTARAGVDGHRGQPAADLVPGMRRTVQIAPQHLLANALGSVRSGSAGHC
jgi:hypothetical protein